MEFNSVAVTGSLRITGRECRLLRLLVEVCPCHLTGAYEMRATGVIIFGKYHCHISDAVARPRILI